MERPKGTIEPAKDHFDHELTQTQVNVIAFADALLERKSKKSFSNVVSVDLSGDPATILQAIKEGDLGKLLASDVEQLASTQDGYNHPELNFQKQHLKLEIAHVLASGQDNEKVRFSDSNATPLSPQDIKRYKGEVDKVRQIDLVFQYRSADGEPLTESVGIYTSTAASDYYYATSELRALAYVQTGYEGHGRKIDYDIDAETAEDFLSLIARHIED